MPEITPFYRLARARHLTSLIYALLDKAKSMQEQGSAPWIRLQAEDMTVTAQLFITMMAIL